MTRRSILVFLLTFLVAAPAFSDENMVVLQISFEIPDDLAGIKGNPKIDKQAGRDGKSCAVVTCPASGGVSLERFFQLPQTDPPRARLLRFSFFVKSSNAKGQLTVSLLKQFKDPKRENGPNEWFDYLKPVFLTAGVASEWSEVRGEGLVGSDVKAIGLNIRISNESGESKVWLDDVRVELLDRGLLLQSGKKGNVFTDETGQMDLIVSDPQKLQAGRVVLKDETGKILADIPLQPNQGDVKIPLPTRGYFDIQTEATYTDGVQATAATRAAVVGPMIPDEVRLKSPFGMSGHGPLFFAAGARWDRRFQNLDSYYKGALENGFTSDRSVPIAGPVAKDPTSIYVFWPQPTALQDVKDKKSSEYSPFHMYPITDRKEFARLVQYVTKQIPQQIEYLEVSNEPDGWNGPWEGLVDYHALMGQAVKAVSPKTKIVGPCLCAIKMHEVKRLVNLGLLKHIDAFSIHAYVDATPPEKEFIDNIRQLKDYMASIGRKDMEILITEFGWAIPPSDWQKPVDPLTQARYCSRSLILMRAEELNAIQWFCLRWADPNSAAACYGLVDWEWLPRPSYAAYANATRCLSGTTGPGRVVNLSPTTYLALFAKDGGGCIAAVWDAEGTGEAFLPSPRMYLRDMMGRPVAESSGEEIAVSPSPVFAELPDDSLYKARQPKPVRLIPGSSVAVAFSPVWIPTKLKFQAGRLDAAADTPAGRYTLLGKSPDGGWLLQPVDVVAPVAIIRQNLIWPLGKANPSLELTLQSNLDTPVKVQTRVILNGLKESSAKTTIAPGQSADVSLPLLDLVQGKRYLGRLKVLVVGRSNIPTLSFAQDITVLACPKGLTDAPAVDFSAWTTSGEQTVKLPQPAPEDCSATLQTTYNDRGLHVRIIVRDNVHRQTKTPKRMWEQDSVQLAFDMDAEKSWVVNQQGGFNGHVRVYEYGAALGENGTMSWRWISGDPDLPPDVVDKRVMVHVKRNGDRTIYKLFFPWQSLGLTSAPPAGSTIGFSLVVNDVDGPDGGRNNLNLFGGIADRKDPAAYGRLYLR